PIAVPVALTFAVTLAMAESGFAGLVDFFHRKVCIGENLFPVFASSQAIEHIRYLCNVAFCSDNRVGAVNLAETVALAEPTNHIFIRNSVSLCDAGRAWLLIRRVGLWRGSARSNASAPGTCIRFTCAFGFVLVFWLFRSLGFMGSFGGGSGIRVDRMVL